MSEVKPSIAGHVFQDNERCVCGMRFADIAVATPEAVGQMGWAHTSTLTQFEYNQIDEERERLWKLVVGSARGGSSVAARESELETTE